jgi:hypothetical protein
MIKQSDIYRQNAENCMQMTEAAEGEPAYNRFKRMEAAWLALAEEQDWLDGEQFTLVQTLDRRRRGNDRPELGCSRSRWLAFLSLLLWLFNHGIDGGERALVLELQSSGSSSGRIKSGPVLRTLPILLSTGQIFSHSSGHGRSSASNSCSVAGSSPSYIGQSLSPKMTGMRLWISAMALFGSHVSMEQPRTRSTLAGSRQFDQRPAITISSLLAMSIA